MKYLFNDILIKKVLEVAVNPACSFRVDASWTRTINSEIKANGGSRVCVCVVCVCDI